MAQRIKTVQESDLRMLGDLARNIQRVLPVTQADIDAAAALGKGWVVTRVFEVSDPLDNLRGGTQLVIRQNSILPGQSVQRVLIVSGPGGQTVVIRGTDYIVLPDAIANSLSYVKAFGGTEQRNLPDNYIERQFIYMMDGSYLQTDIVPTYDCKVEIDFETTGLTPGGTAGILGGRSNTNVGCGLSLRYANSIFAVDAFGLNSNDTYTSSVAPTANTRYKFTYDNQVATLESGGSTLFTNTMTGTQANGAALAINAMNSDGTTVIPGAGIYLYSFKVWNAQGELVADYVPAIQKGTVPVVGFYDTVSKTFKTATAGTFAAGGEAVPTPDAPMDIVSNNGVLKYGFNYYSYNVTRQLSVANYPVELDRSISYSNGVLTCGITGSVGSTNRGLYPTWDMSFTAGHKYACVVMAKGDTRINLGLASIIPSGSVTGGSASDGFYTLTSNYVWYAKRWECNTDSSARLNLRVAGTNVGQYASFKDILVIDLTAIFGAGNEPTTSSDIIQRTVEIYTDGTVETINAHGKNLFNKNGTLANGYYKPADGDWVASAAFRTQDYIKASPNTNYALTVTNLQSGGNFLVMSAWDSEHNWLGTVASNTTSGAAGTSITITGIAPTNTAYLSVSVAIDFRDINTLQLEKGSAATEYAPYYDGGTATAEMLLKVGNYQDQHEIIDGTVTRRVGVKVLDGTESFGGGQASGVQCVQITKAALGISSDTLPADSLDLICTHYKAVNGSDWAQSKPNTIKVGSGYLFFNTQYVRDSSSFEAYLADQYAAGTPVIVIYPLATPTTETVTGQTLQVTDDDNVLEITQASLNNLELEAEYQAAVSLTIQEVQDANLDPNVEVTIN